MWPKMTKNEIQMANAINYGDWRDIKKCLRSLDQLQSAAEAGNMTAAVIYTDIVSAFKSLSGRQKQSIKLVMLQGITIQEAAVKLDITHQCVADYIKNACKKISYILVDENDD
jgi:DNA-directed RNA polymerase specialized sigma24 family protein